MSSQKRESSRTLKTEEGQDAYCWGGFHPVYLGQVYNGKYEVLRKLGSGRYSTVWLVRNKEYDLFIYPGKRTVNNSHI